MGIGSQLAHMYCHYVLARLGEKKEKEDESRRPPGSLSPVPPLAVTTLAVPAENARAGAAEAEATLRELLDLQRQGCGAAGGAAGGAKAQLLEAEARPAGGAARPVNPRLPPQTPAEPSYLDRI